ncbi:endoplasmic reticulum-Golgi intermediate compartment protein 2 [Tremella mesenterica]|uniref:Endoplasmic reticulum-Golgi intermediate compartment protein 2 n=1 Tax=Tremella mesenterica TaxID=5217 RepID=A0A4Q1BQW7_TREME|nr:endoplasmic reticulum-Golgi intermediate compartment protein 2 [Tremella mesenterica]
MYEPHLIGHDNDIAHSDGQGVSLLDELDKIAPIKSFDAFPKVQSTYTSQSRRGAVLTALVGFIIFLLVLNDLGEYLYGAPDYTFDVDQQLQKDLQLNVDLTVAMPCHFLSIDLRDAVGDRLHLSDGFTKEGTTFAVGKALTARTHPTPISASQVISSSRRRTPTQQRSFSGIRRLLSSRPKRRTRKHAMFRPTPNKADNGPACRIYGSVEVKKVTANLHITTLGHGYMSFEHTDHALMNLSHVVHEFSFGPFFPAIAQPLDMTMQVSDNPFTAIQYFLRVVPTTYIDANGRKLVTSQYAVTDYLRSFQHGQGVPGIFFKYDLEAMAVTVRERTTSLYHFVIRLIGVIGGVWTVASYALRVLNRAEKQFTKVASREKPLMPSAYTQPASVVGREGPSPLLTGRIGSGGRLLSRSSSHTSGNGALHGDESGPWRAR